MLYTSGDAELYYQVEGTGQEMILLHPTPVQHGFWQPVSRHLASRYRLITPDLRGHGQSQPGEGTISIERLGEDIVRLLDALKIQRALFVGCSIGGYTLFELWRRVPERIQALAFCCSKPQPDSPENKVKRQQTIEQIRLQGAESFFDSMASTLVGPTTQRRDPGKVSAAREMMRAMRPEAVMAVQQGLAERPDSVPTARSIHVPTCVIAGGEDQSSTPAEMKVLAESIRNNGYSSEYHLITDAGHYAPWERPDEVAGILRRFFASVQDPG